MKVQEIQNLSRNQKMAAKTPKNKKFVINPMEFCGNRLKLTLR